MKTRIFLTGLFLMAALFVNAQTPDGKGNGKCNGTGKGVAYVDKNNDGICDNYATRQAGIKKGNGKGNCNGKGQGKGKRRNFVDTNNNGVCDKRENLTK